jgi:hypothetical protein
MEPFLYNLLLKNDVHDLANNCYLNKNTLNICNTKQFWIDRGLQESTLIFAHQLSDYIKLEKINNIVNHLILLFETESIFLDSSIQIHFNFWEYTIYLNHHQIKYKYSIQDIINLLPNKMKQEIIQFMIDNTGIDVNYHLHIYFKNNSYNDIVFNTIALVLIYTNKWDEKLDDKIIPFTDVYQFIEFLISLLYHYPKMGITDEKHLTYIFSSRIKNNHRRKNFGIYTKLSPKNQLRCDFINEYDIENEIKSLIK